MSLSNPNKPVTEERLQEFYHKIVPYMGGAGGGGSYTAGDGIDITEDVISTKQSEEGDIDEIIDVYPQAGSLVSIVNAFNKGDIYSTQEKMIGQWYDGKPLYQITITGLNVTPSYNVWTRIITGASTTYNIENLVKTIPYNMTGNLSSMSLEGLGIEFRLWDGNIDAEYSQNTIKRPIEVLIIQYTKTTDTAISIGSETEYSTDEKVVGTWIDGSPLYQKTIDCGALPNNTTKDIQLNIANIETIVDIKGVALRNGAVLTIPRCYSNNAYNIDVSANTSVLSIATAFDYSAYSGIITIQYTKTTT